VMPDVGVIGARGRLGSRVVDTLDVAGWHLVLSATTDGWLEQGRADVVIDASRSGQAPVAERRVDGGLTDLFVAGYYQTRAVSFKVLSRAFGLGKGFGR
jgi:hypothetical protein